MTIDTEDKLWVACYSVGKVVRFDPTTGIYSVQYIGVNETQDISST